MSTAGQWKILPSDKEHLRDLAARLMEASHSSENVERRRLWIAHDEGKPERPMVLAEVSGVMNEALPDSALSCTEDWARGIERGMRVKLYEFEVLRDDHVIEPFMDCGWTVSTSGYGVEATQHHADNEGHLGARNAGKHSPTRSPARCSEVAATSSRRG